MNNEQNISLKVVSQAPVFICSLILALTIIIPSSSPLSAMPQQTEKAEAGGVTNSQSGSAGQNPGNSNQIPAKTVIVTAPRMEIPLNATPAATMVIPEEFLQTMPRAIAAEEALKLVPGVKVDNQANGERVHLSIRGQGLLTERGIRGVKILLDGLPLNDPTGFAPDLFDVDWAIVDRIEVFRGLSSAMYGGGGAGGVINITTRNGNAGVCQGNGGFTYGSNGFYKIMSGIDGSVRNMNYRISASNNSGDGFRVHTAFRALNLYSKFTWQLSNKGRLTAIIGGVNYFNENAEGLNAKQVSDDIQQPNPDALTFNEYQRTRRITTGLTGEFKIAGNQDLSFSMYYRNSSWRESVPSSVQHRSFNTPGATIQYTIHSGGASIKNHFTVGSDLDWQTIGQYRNANLGYAVEGDRLSNDDIYQRGAAVYLLNRVELGLKWSLMADLRYDNIHNELTDKFKAAGVDLSGAADFSKTTVRIGAAWNPNPIWGLYASWGQGFLPPATEELANNPAHLGGFNMSLNPATSNGEEIGVRGQAGKRFFYDVAFFHLATKNDFGRYRVQDRPLETFYQNAGDSRRYGIETIASWYPIDPLVIRVSHTYSDFKYTNVNSLWGDFHDVWMPNSPRNQAYLDIEYRYRNRLFAGFGADMTSRAYIDQTNVGYAWGYALFNPRVGYRWNSASLKGEITLSARNAFGKKYIAFAEPDPDGNSYQPGSRAEIFIGARFYIGKNGN
jgi:iron complex outermembrane recepter protein